MIKRKRIVHGRRRLHQSTLKALHKIIFWFLLQCPWDSLPGFIELFEIVVAHLSMLNKSFMPSTISRPDVVDLQEGVDHDGDLCSCQLGRLLCLQFFGHLNFLFVFRINDLHEALRTLGTQCFNCYLVTTSPTLSKGCIDSAWSVSTNHSVGCRGGVEPVIISRRNDLFQFLNLITCGHCSTSSLSHSFLSGVESPSMDLPSQRFASKKSVYIQTTTTNSAGARPFGSPCLTPSSAIFTPHFHRQLRHHLPLTTTFFTLSLH